MTAPAVEATLQPPGPFFHVTLAVNDGPRTFKTSGHQKRVSLLGGAQDNYSPIHHRALPSATYHDRQAFDVSEPAARSPTLRQRLKKIMYMPRSPWTWAFLLTVIGQAVIGLALEA